LSPYSPREAYQFTAEDSIYIKDDYRGKGIGSAILRELLDRADALKYRAIIARIEASQTASVALHAKFGFKEVGLLEDVGYKFDQWLNVVYMERLMREK
jgi:L-amino acid N-acyltransferase